MNKLLIGLVALAVLGIILASGSFIANNSKATTLKKSQLSSAIQGNMGNRSDGARSLVEGRDYVISGTQYFAGESWTVVTISSLDESKNSAILVLQKVDDSYQVVLGPGTGFTATELSFLPRDVAFYINNRDSVSGLR